MGESRTKGRGDGWLTFPQERWTNISKSNGTGEGGWGSKWGEILQGIKNKSVCALRGEAEGVDLGLLAPSRSPTNFHK